MENFRIILIPADASELFYEFEQRCKDLNAASDFAKVNLVMNGGKYKEARVMSRWKPDLSYRQAIDPIIYSNNL